MGFDGCGWVPIGTFGGQWVPMGKWDNFGLGCSSFGWVLGWFLWWLASYCLWEGVVVVVVFFFFFFFFFFLIIKGMNF